MKAEFGEVREEGDLLVSSFGAMSRIEARVVSKSAMEVSTESRRDVEDSTILESKRALNRFVEAATGFDAKTRMKRAQKKVKEGTL